MARKISVEIVGDASSLERAFKKSSRSAKSFQGDITKTKRSFGGLPRVAGLASAALGAAGLAGAARMAFDEMQQAEQVTAQTNAALKSTAGVAKVSAKRVDKLADSILRYSGIDDEATKTAENMLLTFTDIRNETGKGNKIFDRATKAVADLATRMNGGAVPAAEQMQQASLQLGKALNDPIKGVGALRRVGIQFTADQQKQIKTLVEANDKLGAQKIILQELQKEFGGSARAAGDTFAGKLSILRNTLLNLGASIATTLTPAITKLVDKLVAWLSKSKNQKQILDTVNAAVAVLTTAVKLLTGAFRFLNSITGSTKNTFKLLLAAFVAFKALKLISYIAGMSKAMRGFAIASAEANAAGAAGGVGGMGKFGKVLGAAGAVAVGAPIVAGAVRKIPGWDKTFKGVGGWIAGQTVARREGSVTIQGDVHVHDVPNVPKLENELHKRARQRHRNTRRGAR